jgi:hypothetical protein
VNLTLRSNQVHEVRVFYANWLSLMNFPGGANDPVKIPERIWPTNLTDYPATRRVEGVWDFIRELRLFERDEVVHLSYTSELNLYKTDSLERHDRFFHATKTGAVGGKKSKAKRVSKTPKGYYDPVRCIIRASQEAGKPYQCKDGMFFAVGAYCQPQAVMVPKTKKPAKVRFSSPVASPPSSGAASPRPTSPRPATPIPAADTSIDVSMMSIFDTSGEYSFLEDSIGNF